MSDGSLRSVSIERTGLGRYVARAVDGTTLSIGGEHDFSPVELLLAAIGSCTASDVDHITSKRSEPEAFSLTVTADKVRDTEIGNHLDNLAVTFTVRFPAGEAGDAAREVLPRAAKQSHDRLCTVSRTVEVGSPVSTADR